MGRGGERDITWGRAGRGPTRGWEAWGSADTDNPTVLTLFRQELYFPDVEVGNY